jgi:hypothetical protein
MKLTIKIFLAILLIPLIVILVGMLTIRFQFLREGFWLSTFEKSNFYEVSASLLKSQVEGQIVKEGGKESDAAVFTEIITTENIQQVVNRNTEYFLDFAGGKNEELLVYLPLGDFPPGFLPDNLNVSAVTPLPELLEKFDITQKLPLRYISGLTAVVSYALIVIALLIIIIAVGIFKLHEQHKKIIGLFIPLTISGLLILMLGFFARGFAPRVFYDLGQTSFPGNNIFEVLIMSVVSEVVKFWEVAGVAVLILGIIFAFVRKR